MKRSGLKLPKSLELPSGQKLAFDHVSTEDIREIRNWKRFARQGSTPAQRQSVKIALSAAEDWIEALKDGSAARSLSEVFDHINENPHAEAWLFLCARSDNFEHGRVIGIFLLRRTWFGSMWADYIAIHPLVARNPDSGFKGVGTVAFCVICLIARELNIKRILGEATAFSHEFYELILERKVNDIVVVPKRKYEELLRRVE